MKYKSEKVHKGAELYNINGKRKGNPSQLNCIFTCGHTRIHHIYCTSSQKKEKWKNVSTLTKVLLYTVKCCHSDALIFNLRPRKKMYKSFSMDSMWGSFCSIEYEDLKERKGLVKDKILTLIVIIITKIGINRTGKHNLH